jgi:hypothetical protein
MMPYDRNDPRGELSGDRLEPAPEPPARTENEDLAKSLAALFTMFGGHALDDAPRE